MAHARMWDLINEATERSREADRDWGSDPKTKVGNTVPSKHLGRGGLVGGPLSTPKKPEPAPTAQPEHADWGTW